jgi:uncharacterized membrane-anchored protein
MNKILISLGVIFVLIMVISMIGNFFNIKQEYYLPYIFWLVTLCVLNILLDEQHENVFMKNIKV